ncbi:amino acid adenylation domain-containing protein [Bacillus tropicus]|uniref:non-ribosomal peptide synthetase n=1 Tax=Bacillus tropicus TaxID=2026188 RepID=UPI00111F1EB0|nr:non-ribosomal peptide synthetase [Bacillus tropicus]TNP12929.1 amino acid adenylation domain-containing protein [Bacillus tropicus]
MIINTDQKIKKELTYLPRLTGNVPEKSNDIPYSIINYSKPFIAYKFKNIDVYSLGAFAKVLSCYCNTEQVHFHYAYSNKEGKRCISLVEITVKSNQKVKEYLDDINRIINTLKMEVNNEEDILYYNDYPKILLNALEEEVTFNNDQLVLNIDNTSCDIKLIHGLDFLDSFYAEQLVKEFSTVLERMLTSNDKNLSEVKLIDSKEEIQIITEYDLFNHKDYKIGNICDAFEELVQSIPDKVAIKYNNVILTYSDLNKKANQVARFLKKMGVSKGDLIGVLLEKSIEPIICFLGILKAGAGYVPMDPNYPKERIKYIIENAQINILLSNSRHSESILSSFKDMKVIYMDYPECFHAESTENLDSNIEENDVAYVLYTSGSTGKPKGVVIPHRGVTRLVINNDYAKFNQNDIFLQLASFSFDAAAFELWGALLNGAQLTIIPQEDVLSSKKIAQFILKEQISIALFMVPIFNRIIEDNLAGLKNVRLIFVGGDSPSIPHLRTAKKFLINSTIINAYGPTENSVISACYTIKEIHSNTKVIPIGRPITHTSIYILDKDMNILPIGIPGEIYLGGRGLALGYLNDSEKTNQSFIEMDFPPRLGLGREKKVLYKTGDYGKRLPNGDIEFIGRSDQQVKIRGFRIEMAEIESAILSIESIKEVVIVVKENHNSKKLIAFYVSRKDLNPNFIKENLKVLLPEFMIPSEFVQLDHIPINSNGKIDKKSLLGEKNEQLSVNKIESGNDLFGEICKVWEAILDKNINQEFDMNFFDLGGDSLLLMALHSKLCDYFNVEFPINDLLVDSSINGVYNSLNKIIKNRKG